MTSRHTEPELDLLGNWSTEHTRGLDIQLIDVGVEYPVDEADARALVRILVWQLDMDLPKTTFERGYRSLVHCGS